MNIDMVTPWVQFAAESLIFAGVAYNTVQSCLTNRKLKKVHIKVAAVENTTAKTNAVVEEVKITTADTNNRVEAVEVSSNGMREAIVSLTEKEAFARGSVAGATEERERQQLGQKP